MATIKELAVSRADVFILKVSDIAPVPGFNIREDVSAFIARALKGDFSKPPADIVEMAQSVRQNGVQFPILGHKTPEDKFAPTTGHRRFAGCILGKHQIAAEKEKAAGDKALLAKLKEELERCLVIPVMSEPKGKQQVDRHYDTLTSNDGKPLTLLEEALEFERLMKEFGQSEADILRRTGKSRTHFTNCFLLLNGGSPELIAAVQSGKIAATLAIEMVRKQPDKAEQTRMLNEALEKAAAAGRPQATAKHLNEQDREKVSPKKSSRIPRGGGGGGGDSGGSSPSKKQEPEKLSLGKKTATASVELPKGCGVEANILIAGVATQRGEGRGFVFAVQVKYGNAKKFTGNEPEADAERFDTIAEAQTEALKVLKDDLLAAKRTAGKDSAVKWDHAIAAVDQHIGNAEKSAGSESVVPGATRNPADHIRALRDKLKEDKRSKKMTGSKQFLTLNFIADYFTGKYTPEQFEKHFTDFMFGKDK